MSSCELCGKESDSLQKVKIEGATLNVCDSCSDIGKSVGTKSKKKKTKKSRGRSKRPSQVLRNDYGTALKEARESEQLSLKEVADDLNEKESLISKIEKQELKPDETLAKKLAKKFGLTLYVNPEVADYSQEKADSRSATMEDIADVKRS